jgi:hypothetical protein
MLTTRISLALGFIVGILIFGNAPAIILLISRMYIHKSVRIAPKDFRWTAFSFCLLAMIVLILLSFLFCIGESKRTAIDYNSTAGCLAFVFIITVLSFMK